MTQYDQQSGGAQIIDLNADLGEGYGPWTMGDDAAMFTIVTSANVACGGHASDPETMYRTLCLAREHQIVVGAHPSFPDREGFGRRRLPYAPAEIERFVAAQIGALIAISTLAEHPVRYVKPHGALANLGAEDRAVADALVRAIRAVDSSLAILAISGTVFERSARDAGLSVFSEVFVDRGYDATGNLVPRDQSGALIEDAETASDRIIRFLETGQMPVVGGGDVRLQVDSLCIHGDSAHAVAMARRVRDDLKAAGKTIAPFLALHQ